MRSEVLRLLVICAALAAVSGCGQKGPLYLPDKTGEVVTRPTHTPASAPATPAPQTPSPNSTQDSTPTSDPKKANEPNEPK